MTAVLVIVALALLLGVLFVVAVVRPRRSRRMQEAVDRTAGRARAKATEDGGRMGRIASRGVSKMQKAADRSAEKGREVRGDGSS